MRALRKARHPDAERTFARRLPDGDKLLKEIDETKSFYDEAYFSDAGQRKAPLEGLRTLGVPRSITWLLVKLTLDRSENRAKKQM
jgi:hypothetical protein